MRTLSDSDKNFFIAI